MMTVVVEGDDGYGLDVCGDGCHSNDGRDDNGDGCGGDARGLDNTGRGSD